MADNDWKKRLGMVYSTNPDYTFVENDTADEQTETLPKTQQRLRVGMERAGRKGKTVTLVKGFVGSDDDLKILGKRIKTRLGTGGTIKDSEIVIQGDVRAKIIELLRAEGYTDTK